METVDSRTALTEILQKADDHVGCLANLLDRSPVGIQIYRINGQSIYENRTFLEIFQAKPPPEYNILKDEIAEKTGATLYFRRAFAGESVQIPVIWYDPRELQHVKVTEGRGVAIQTDLVPLKTSNGEVTHVVCYTKMFETEKTVLDAHIKNNRELLNLNSLFRQLIDGSEVVMYAKDSERRTIFGNSQFEKVLSIQPTDYLGKKDLEFMSPQQAASLQKNDELVLSTGLGSESREVVTDGDGVPQTYISAKFPLKDVLGKNIGICGISTNITESLRMERELSAAKRMESLGLLASGMTHDFNNILSIIAMYAESLSDKLLDEQHIQKTAVQKILAAVEKAGTLTRQLRTFGRKHFVLADWIDLNAAIQSNVETLQSMLSESHRLELNLASNLPAVFLEATQVDQILLNLCLNAKDAIPEDGTIQISTRLVQLDRSITHRRLNAPPGEYVLLEIKDNGAGMDPEVSEKAFEPFFTTKSYGRGTGLGLASVYGIVWHAGGDIRLESTPRQGSVFSFYFPTQKTKNQNY